MTRHGRPWSSALLACFFVATTSGCGVVLAPAFDSRFRHDPGESQAALLALQAAPSHVEGAVMLATTDGGRAELVAYDMAAGKLLWQTPLSPSARPVIAGDLALVATGPRLFAFGLRDGAPRFSVPLGAPTFLGAARDGNRVFFTARREGAPGRRPLSVLAAVDAHSGRELWRHEVSGELGRPIARGGVVAVAWERQRLSLLDARSGDELSRMRARDDVIDWVESTPSGVQFGHHNVYRLGPDGYSGSRNGAPRFEPSPGVLPGRPAPRASSFEHFPGTATARGRVALHFDVVGEERLQLARDRYYLLFYRHVFALDGKGQVRWARVLPGDAIMAHSYGDGLVVVMADGALRAFGAVDGRTLYQQTLGVRLASAALRITELPPPKTAADPVDDLRHALVEVALDPDNRLVPARAWAIRRLAELPEPAITADLLDIYDQSSTPPELKAAVADALLGRESGSEYLIDALMARYDFLDQTRPPPLSVIVPALRKLRDARAVPHLIERMWDHETPLGVLPMVVEALVELGDASVADPLLEFLRTYHADGSMENAPDALLAAARGLLEHGDEGHRDALAALSQSPSTRAALSAGLAPLLEPPRAAPAAAQPPAVARAAPLPALLDQSDINAVFSEQADALRGCIIDELGKNPRLSQVRIAFIAENDGSTHAFSFVPNSTRFVDCVYPHLASLRFPRFRERRQIASYVIAVRAAPKPRRVDPTTGRWWELARAPSAAAPEVSGGLPWWHARTPIVRIGESAQRSPHESATGRTPPHEARAPTPAPPGQPPAAATASPAAPAAPGTVAGGAAAGEPSRPAREDAPPTKDEPPAPAPAVSDEPEDAWWVPQQ